MIATSKIRRRDRRGVTPDHVLYMGMKILRLRVSQNIQHLFVCNKENDRITRADIQNADFLKENLEKNRFPKIYNQQLPVLGQQKAGTIRYDTSTR
jgi:hypothetical protein